MKLENLHQSCQTKFPLDMMKRFPPASGTSIALTCAKEMSRTSTHDPWNAASCSGVFVCLTTASNQSFDEVLSSDGDGISCKIGPNTCIKCLISQCTKRECTADKLTNGGQSVTRSHEISDLCSSTKAQAAIRTEISERTCR